MLDIVSPAFESTIQEVFTTFARNHFPMAGGRFLCLHVNVMAGCIDILWRGIQCIAGPRLPFMACKLPNEHIFSTGFYGIPENLALSYSFYSLDLVETNNNPSLSRPIDISRDITVIEIKPTRHIHYNEMQLREVDALIVMIGGF